ncbi:MAG: hypothetical protein HC834_08075 [Rhodospirillales bacterium]|nr:hypothetical protein [Rhodospirillales bacterium]
MDRLVTRKVSDLKPGRVRYALVCREDGGILDDILVYHLLEPAQASSVWLVVNAGNREKIAAWIQAHLPASGVTFADHTEQTAMLAIQGPQALACSQELIGFDPTELSYFSSRTTQVLGEDTLVSRTGYTGEDGFELLLDAPQAPRLWQRLMSVGQDFSLLPAGLGARDTLRLEARYLLYGTDMDETTKQDVERRVQDLEQIINSYKIHWNPDTNKPRLMAEDVVVSLIKDGDHRLSREQDLILFEKALIGLLREAE